MYPPLSPRVCSWMLRDDAGEPDILARVRLDMPLEEFGGRVETDPPGLTVLASGLKLQTNLSVPECKKFTKITDRPCPCTWQVENCRSRQNVARCIRAEIRRLQLKLSNGRGVFSFSFRFRINLCGQNTGRAGKMHNYILSARECTSNLRLNC